MKFIVRKPGVGYLDTWLWLPKTHISDIQVKATFSYVTRKGELVEAWKEELHHYRVPRNFLKHETLAKLPYPVIDTRYRKFPFVEFKSNVILDFKEPTKDYQRAGSAALLDVYDGILCLRCGAGKTVVALHTAAQLNVPILIVVTDSGLAVQWQGAITAFLGIPAEEIGYIGGGKFDWKKKICVAQVSTLAKRATEFLLPNEMLHWFGVIIPDEAHVMGAPYFNNAIPPFAGRRWGLSATPEREDEFDSLLSTTLGDVVFTYLTPDLIPTFLFRHLPTTLNYNDPIIKAGTHDTNGEFHYGMTFGYLARTNKDRRVDLIAKDVKAAVASGRQVLVLAHSREMVDLLGEAIPGSGTVHGGVKGKERDRRIRECNPVISVMILGKQALDKPSLDTLFVAEPFSKKGVLQQVMGRILRIFSGKRDPMVVIYEDPAIRELGHLCGKLRKLLNTWPANKGGRIPYEIVKIKGT